jgi:hypothetical protein
VRNSSLVECPCAENVPGLSLIPKLRICRKASGRGALHAGRSRTERSGGPHGSENAGVSSEMQVRILHTESLRIPGEGSSSLGKSGPNARPKGVADGKQAEIPVPVSGATE